MWNLDNVRRGKGKWSSIYLKGNMSGKVLWEDRVIVWEVGSIWER